MEMANEIANLNFDDVTLTRKAVVEIFRRYLPTATDASAYISKTMYEEIRLDELGEDYEGITESGRKPEATEEAIKAITQKLVDGDEEGFIRELMNRVDYEIKRAAGECAYRNGLRDKARVRFARVPSGKETCQWCIMLASRGFVYLSKESAGELNHYHANCDCRVVPNFTTDKISKEIVEGYDPKEYYKQWKESGFNPNKKS